jgi:hypothetical protein
MFEADDLAVALWSADPVALLPSPKALAVAEPPLTARASQVLPSEPVVVMSPCDRERHDAPLLAALAISNANADVKIPAAAISQTFFKRISTSSVARASPLSSGWQRN